MNLLSPTLSPLPLIPTTLKPTIHLSKPTSLRLKPNATSPSSTSAANTTAAPNELIIQTPQQDFDPFLESPYYMEDYLNAHRMLFLNCDIDDFIADAVISELLLLDAADPTKDIRIFITSTGGDFLPTMAIFDVLQLIRADVSTIALGMVASTPSLLLGCGTKGKRFAMPNARIMIQQPAGFVAGYMHQVEAQAQETQNEKNEVIRIISEISGRTQEQVEKDIDRDRYMSPIEAVEYGLIDGIIERDSILPVAPLPLRQKPKADYLEFHKDPMKFVVS